MPVQVKCVFCNRSFDFDGTGGSLLATCPNCGRQNTVAGPTGATSHLHVRRDAPALIGGPPCPRCQALLEPDAIFCTHCGFNLATGRKITAVRAWAARKAWRLAGCAGLLVIAAFAFHNWRPPTKALKVTREIPVPAASPALPPAIPVEEPEESVPTVEAPQPPDDDHARLEAQKARAEQAFRSRLDGTAPLYQPQDQVQLRLKTGRIIHGTLVLAGKGTNRVAVLDTGGGKSIIRYAEMDRDSRIRLDAKYREEYIRRTLRLAPAGSPTGAPENRK